jgi:hypothetical protein
MKEKKTNSFRGKVISSAQKQKESKGGRKYLDLPKGVKMLKIPEGLRSFTLDFMPYEVTNKKHLERDDAAGVAVPGTLWYRSPLRIHKNVGSDSETVICPRTIGKPCPICEYQVKRIREGADKEEFKLLYPQERSLYVVIPVGHKDFDEVPMVWDMADFLFQETLIEELRENDENEDFFSLENGKTASLRLKWKEMGKSSFPEIVSITFSEREDGYKESVMEDIPDLDGMLKVLSYEEIHAKFFFAPEEVEVEGGTDNEDAPPARTRKSIERVPKKEKDEVVDDNVDDGRDTGTVRKSDIKEATTRTRRRSAPVKEEEEKCPHGHRFGIDTDDFKECNKCKIWEDCIDEKEKK